MILPTPDIQRFERLDRASWLAMRRHDVTASAAGALFGVHPFISAYGLWALKAGLISEDEEDSRPMRRGRLLEPVAIQMLAEDYPTWAIERGGHYYREPALRWGATPDAIVHDPERGLGVVQIKSVEPQIFRRKWRIDGVVEPPLWIAVQALLEARLVGAAWAAVAPMVVGHGLDMPLTDIPLTTGVLERLADEVAAFWRMVEEGRAPDPDYARDASLIEDLYTPTGEVIDLAADNRLMEIVGEKERLAAEMTIGGKRLREIKAEMLAKLGTASAAKLADGRRLAAKIVHRSAYSVKASSYADLRVQRVA